MHCYHLFSCWTILLDTTCLRCGLQESNLARHLQLHNKLALHLQTCTKGKPKVLVVQDNDADGWILCDEHTHMDLLAQIHFFCLLRLQSAAEGVLTPPPPPPHPQLNSHSF